MHASVTEILYGQIALGRMLCTFNKTACAFRKYIDDLNFNNLTFSTIHSKFFKRDYSFCHSDSADRIQLTIISD